MNNDSLKKLVKRDCRKAMLPTVLLYTAGDLAGSLLTVYTAGILGDFADAIFRLDVHSGMKNFWLLAVCLLANFVVVPLIGMAGEVVMFGNSLRHNRYCIGRFLDKAYEDVSGMEAGEVQYRLEEDPISLRCNWVDLTENSIIIPITLSYLLWKSSKISITFTAFTLAVSFLKLIVPVVTKKTLAKYKLQDKEYQTQMRTYEMEIAEKSYAIKLFGIKKSMIKRLDDIYHTYFHAVAKKNIRYKTIADHILSILDTVCVLLILFVGALMVSSGVIMAGSVVAMIGYFDMYHTLISKMDSVIKTWPEYKNNIERVMEMYHHEEKHNGKTIDSVEVIEVESLGFSYGEQMIFRDIDFVVNKKDKLAIVGENGSGKTTLIKILCGLLKHYEGSIKINGTELNALDAKAWMEQFAFVQQDPYLFEGSVMENIKIGNLSANEKEEKAVMEKLGIGYLADRTVSFHEKTLSGGERQKISLARALLKGSSVLVFDEPSNHLDEETRRWIADFIGECDKTVIFISHDEYLTASSGKVLAMK